jgi:RNA polymerase sigma-70 factor (ECF subfamily)
MDTDDTTAKGGFQAADAEALFRRYGPMVLRRCRLMLGDTDAAADAAQTVFVAIFEKRHALKVEYPSSLLWKMATNHCLNVIRERAARGETPGADALLSKIACSEDLEERVGSRGLLQKLFGRHPESSRLIAVLHYVDGMTLEETAKEAGMSVSGVRKRLLALRKTLAEMTDGLA